MGYTVKQLAKMAGVTTRTLHYYDEINLLRPTSYGGNGYRYYGEDAVLRLQQIRFFRELDFSLEQIKIIIDQPDFDLMYALESHKRALLQKVDRLNSLLETVDQTMKHIRGEIKMSQEDFYKGFDEEKQKEYAKEAQRRWGEPAAESQKRWDRLTSQEKNDILAELHQIGQGVADHMDKGHDSADVQHWIARWHQAINKYFYDCSLEMFENLGHMYVEDPEFSATYEKIRPGMAVFMEKAMTYYCEVQAT